MTEPAHLRATRTAYDTVAVDYDVLLRDELAGKPGDRAQLDAFAELVQAAGDFPVADLGCGPGRITAYLRARGLNAFGIDLSPAMISVACASYPDLTFATGTMADLHVADGALGGIVAWYSIIHTPPESMPAMFAEFHRVLAPGGYLLLAFQVGETCVHLEHAYGHDIELDAYRLSPDTICDVLLNAGFVVCKRSVRDPEGVEKTPQAYVLARRPVRP